MKAQRKNSAEQYVGRTLTIHGGKITATVYKAFSSTAVLLDYDGYFDPEDKHTRISGRKLVSVSDLQTPERIAVGQFKQFISSRD